MMWKKWLSMGLLASALMIGTSALAVDYSQYSTEELSKMRGTLRNATEEEREAFRAEWQKRMREMSPEERMKYVGPPDNATRDGQGYQYGRGKGRGQGQGMGQGQGQGMGRGMGKGRGMGRGRGCPR